MSRKSLAYSIGILFSLIYMYQSMFGIFAPEYHRGLFILCTLILVFLLKPFKKVFFVDIVLIILSLIGIIYFIIRYPQYNLQYGLPINNLDILIGSITIVLVLEVCRRSIGWPLVALALLFIIYLYQGRNFPISIRHGGFDWNTIISTTYAGLNGIFGSITYIFAEYVFLLIVFGTFLKKAGATDFYIDLAKSMVGHTKGGPAKISVISSGLIGSVTGSSTANVAITGTMTIPFMKKTGFTPFQAGAIEAAASYGGTILPPIMGAAAFIMSALINVPYITIIKYAAIPAIMYYVGVFSAVHFDACKLDIALIPKGTFPGFKETFLKGGHLFFPPILLVSFLYLGFSMAKIATSAIISVVICSAIRKETRMSIKQILDALAEGAHDSLAVLAVLGAVQIITVGVFLPGIGLRISNMIIQLSGGTLFLTILIIFVLSYILGMGLPITPAYLILATLAAPSLINLGAPLLGSHLLVLWWSNVSAITPPVCLAVYVACALAKSSLWQTGFEAVKKACMNFILPWLFIYDPLLLLNGSPVKILIRCALIVIGIISFQGGLVGYFLRENKVIETIILLGAGVLTFIPDFYLNFIGLGCFITVVLLQLWEKGVLKNSTIRLQTKS